MNQDEKLSGEAVKWVHKNSQKIIFKFAGDTTFVAKGQAISVFMAGSPGAGKTEISKEMVKQLNQHPLVQNVVRIDPDEIRDMLPQYTGGNAHLFQQAISIGTDKVFNYALKTNRHILLDGTFSRYERAHQNISKTLRKNRMPFIMYVYTDPLLAWRFTQARERKEGRNIPKEDFIKHFFAAKETVEKIKQRYGNKVQVEILAHNYESLQRSFFENVESIDKYIKIGYTADELKNIL